MKDSHLFTYLFAALLFQYLFHIYTIIMSLFTDFFVSILQM